MLSGVLAIRVHTLWGLKPQMKYFIAACWTLSSVCALTLNIRAILWIIREIAYINVAACHIGSSNLAFVSAANETSILDLKTCVTLALPDHLYTVWVPGV